MIVEAVSAEVASVLGTIPQLNTFPYWAKKVPVPGVTVGLPELIEYDQTYGRGLDKMRLPILVMVGMVSDRSSAKQLGAYMDGEGPRSFKAVLNGHTWESCDDVMVAACEPDTYSSGGVILLGAEFTVDVFGQGQG